MNLKDFVGITSGLSPEEVTAMVRLADIYWDARKAGVPGIKVDDVAPELREFVVELFEYDHGCGLYVHRGIEALLHAKANAAGQLLVLFDEFWKLYPRKVAKAPAQKAWKARVRTETLARQVITALRRHIAAHQWHDKARLQYVPHAASWLNAERWNDELETAAPSSMVDA